MLNDPGSFRDFVDGIDLEVLPTRRLTRMETLKMLLDEAVQDMAKFEEQDNRLTLLLTEEQRFVATELSMVFRDRLRNQWAGYTMLEQANAVLCWSWYVWQALEGDIQDVEP